MPECKTCKQPVLKCECGTHCPKCGSTNLFEGFGLAGGGYGAYRGCEDCDWFEKDRTATYSKGEG